MSTLNRYILRQLAETFVIVLLVLTALVWVSQALRLLNLVIEKGRSVTEFLELTMLLVPWLMGLIAPSALFVACAYILNRMNGDSELVVVHAAGTSRWRLLTPFLTLSVLVTVFIVFVNLLAMPWGMREFRHKLVEVRTDLISTLVQEGQFVSPEAGIMVHIKDQTPAGELVGLIFNDDRDPAASVTYLAERARLVTGADGPVLWLQNGTAHRRRAGSNNVDVVKFDEYALDLGAFAGAADVTYYEPPEKYLSELLNPAPDDEYSNAYAGKVWAEAHDRLSNPLYAIAMMLIVFAGMSDARTTRQNRIVVVLVIVALAVAVRVTGATVINLTAKNDLFTPLAYAVPLLTIAASIATIIVQVQRGSAALRQDRGAAVGIPPPARPLAAGS